MRMKRTVRGAVASILCVKSDSGDQEPAGRSS
jgi:hypothetical protein